MSLPLDVQATAPASSPSELSRSADAWQRRFGVPWERVERAVRAVSDRAAAASRRRFAAADGAAAPASSKALPG